MSPFKFYYPEIEQEMDKKRMKKIETRYNIIELTKPNEKVELPTPCVVYKINIFMHSGSARLHILIDGVLVDSENVEYGKTIYLNSLVQKEIELQFKNLSSYSHLWKVKIHYLELHEIEANDLPEEAKKFKNSTTMDGRLAGFIDNLK